MWRGAGEPGRAVGIGAEHCSWAARTPPTPHSRPSCAAPCASISVASARRTCRFCSPAGGPPGVPLPPLQSLVPPLVAAAGSAVLACSLECERTSGHGTSVAWWSGNAGWHDQRGAAQAGGCGFGVAPSPMCCASRCPAHSTRCRRRPSPSPGHQERPAGCSSGHGGSGCRSRPAGPSCRCPPAAARGSRCWGEPFPRCCQRCSTRVSAPVQHTSCWLRSSARRRQRARWGFSSRLRRPCIATCRGRSCQRQSSCA